jgi:prepilin-type N-terminal cleavage/methylation domain-containing protein
VKRKGFTLIELLVVVAIIALLISILLPSLARARELSKRAVCAANVRGIGQSCKIYANDFSEQWPIAPYLKTGFTGITAIGGVYHRNGPTASPAGSGGLPVADPSIGQCFWIIIKSGGTTNKQFICPSSSDQADNTANPMTYFDFNAPENLSYGYQMPYAGGGVPNESVDPGLPMIADKCMKTVCDAIGNGKPSDFMGDPIWNIDAWKLVASSHHSDGEGQNVLYQDGHASFEKRVAAGVASAVHPLTGVSPYNHQDLIYENAYDTTNKVRGGYNAGDTSKLGYPRDGNDAAIAHSPCGPLK